MPTREGNYFINIEHESEQLMLTKRKLEFLTKQKFKWKKKQKWNKKKQRKKNPHFALEQLFMLIFQNNVLTIFNEKCSMFFLRKKKNGRIA